MENGGKQVLAYKTTQAGCTWWSILQETQTSYFIIETIKETTLSFQIPANAQNLVLVSKKRRGGGRRKESWDQTIYFDTVENRICGNHSFQGATGHLC